MTFATWRPVFTQGHALIGSEKPCVRDDAAGIEFDFDLLARLAHFHTAANEGRGNRVAIGMQRHVAFSVDDALMQPVNFRNAGG